MPLEVNIDVQGLQGLVRLMAVAPELYTQAVQDTATQIRNLIIGRTPVGVGPTSGNLKGSWSSVQAVSGGFTFGTDVEYSEILELGGYRNTGPRTVEYEGSIYSRQAPGGIISPVIGDEEEVNRIANDVAEELVRRMQRYVRA